MKLWGISGSGKFRIHVLNVCPVTVHNLWACTAFYYLNKNNEVAMQLNSLVGSWLSAVTNWNSQFSTPQYCNNYVGTQNMGQEFELCIEKEKKKNENSGNIIDM